MQQTERIEYMEKLFDEVSATVKEFAESLDNYAKAQQSLNVLAEYLQNKDWQRDYSDAERGLLPKTLKCGVLSQDGLWDLLQENDRILSQIKSLL